MPSGTRKAKAALLCRKLDFAFYLQGHACSAASWWEGAAVYLETGCFSALLQVGFSTTGDHHPRNPGHWEKGQDLTALNRSGHSACVTAAPSSLSCPLLTMKSPCSQGGHMSHSGHATWNLWAGFQVGGLLWTGRETCEPWQLLGLSLLPSFGYGHTGCDEQSCGSYLATSRRRSRL